MQGLEAPKTLWFFPQKDPFQFDTIPPFNCIGGLVVLFSFFSFLLFVFFPKFFFFIKNFISTAMAFSIWWKKPLGQLVLACGKALIGIIGRWKGLWWWMFEAVIQVNVLSKADFFLKGVPSEVWIWELLKVEKEKENNIHHYASYLFVYVANNLRKSNVCVHFYKIK